MAGNAFRELTVVLDRPALERLEEFGEISVAHPDPSFENIHIVFHDVDVDRERADVRNQVDERD